MENITSWFIQWVIPPIKQSPHIVFYSLPYSVVVFYIPCFFGLDYTECKLHQDFMFLGSLGRQEAELNFVDQKIAEDCWALIVMEKNLGQLSHDLATCQMSITEWNLILFYLPALKVRWLYLLSLNCTPYKHNKKEWTKKNMATLSMVYAAHHAQVLLNVKA